MLEIKSRPFAKARMRLKLNVNYVLRDKDGNVKPLFQPNKLAISLMKKGLLNPASNLARSPIFGKWNNQMLISNLVTNAGMAGVASRINGAGGEAAFTYIALGTGTNAAAVGDTALQTEITNNGGARANASASRTTTDVSNDTARLQNTFNFTGTFAITESGVLNAASSGVLLARQVFTAVNVGNGDSLQVTWDIDVD